ncbi:hypothetical protein NN561_002753 [Cricetulus griseus]
MGSLLPCKAWPLTSLLGHSSAVTRPHCLLLWDLTEKGTDRLCEDKRKRRANRRSHRLGAPSPLRPAGGGDGGNGRSDNFVGFSRVIVNRGTDTRIPPLPTKVREGKEGEPARNFARQTRQQRWREPSTAPTTRRPTRAQRAAALRWRPLIGCLPARGRARRHVTRLRWGP